MRRDAENEAPPPRPLPSELDKGDLFSESGGRRRRRTAAATQTAQLGEQRSRYRRRQRFLERTWQARDSTTSFGITENPLEAVNSESVQRRKQTGQMERD